MRSRPQCNDRYDARTCHGFSLIELLIVVSIILIIASMAIPNLLRAKIAANESSAVGSIRAIATAQIMYQSTFPTIGFSGTLAALGPNASGCATTGPTSANACLIDWTLAHASTSGFAKSGYYFGMGTVVENTVNVEYTVGAAPAAFNQIGVRGFCANEDAVIRFTPALNGPPVIRMLAAWAIFLCNRWGIPEHRYHSRPAWSSRSPE